MWDSIVAWLDEADHGLQIGWGVFGFLAPYELISWATIIGFLTFAFLAYRLHHRGDGSFWKQLTDRKVWLHRSAKLDFKYYLLIQPLRIMVIAPLLALALLWTGSGVLWGMEAVFGAEHVAKTAPAWGLPLYSVVMFVAADFAFFFSHYLSHRWPLLWCFHKVHHTAEVLTPFTAMRFHPLDVAWAIAFTLAFTGIASGICQYLFYPAEIQWLLLGNGLFVALSYITTHNLRHSHLWLAYPGWLSRWIISPAMHQLHHSREKRHIDRNMGYLLSCWDRWFATAYVPVEKETFQLGVKGMPKDGILAHRSFASLLHAPFRESRLLIAKAHRERNWRALVEWQSAPPTKRAAESVAAGTLPTEAGFSH